MEGWGAVKNHKSEWGDLVPESESERKGVEKTATATEVGVKMATPCGRIKD